MRLAIFIIAVFAPLQHASAQFSGPAVAIDGDTLEMTGERVRLSGIDAPEAAQTCERTGEAWACGKDATAFLARLVAGRTVECEQRDRDAYGRSVSICRVGDRDLGSSLLLAGLAVAASNAGDDYAEVEGRARTYRQGIWASVFQRPEEFRAANPRLFAPPPVVRVARAASRPASQPSGQVWFRNCAAARAAGAAPLYRGRPGYRPEMDGDGDGIACEPYRGR